MKRTIILLIVCLTFGSSASVVYAQMINEEHTLQLNPADDFESEPITPQITPTIMEKKSKLRKLEKLIEPKQQNISININTDLLSFGVISPTSPNEREMEIKLGGSALSKILYIKRQGQLQNESESIIHDTSCDQGTCSQFIASDWINTLTFGFGYSCKAKGCEEDFQHGGFRPFSADLTSVYETLSEDETMTLPVRINIPGTQTTGTYTTNITVLSVPTL